MPPRSFLAVSVLLMMVVLLHPVPVTAATRYMPQQADSAYDLINAVNALRLSNGLPAYSISSILMYTAQNQADFMAATGTVTHSGPGGISLTDRLLAAGYPLAGDLSLGGFRSENIIAGSENMSAQSAVDAWTGDAPHLNTMLSPNLTEIGAGVAVAVGKVYYVIDAALPKSGGAAPAFTQVAGGGSAVPANEAPISVVVISTPNPSGDVTHEVLSGQTLWQIAISYKVKIDDIKRLNNLAGNEIYPGEKLLIKKGVFLSTETPAVTPTLAATATATLTSTSAPTVVPVSPTSIPVLVVRDASKSSKITAWLVGILALALLGGALFARFGNSKREQVMKLYHPANENEEKGV